MLNTIMDTVRNNSGKLAVGLGGLAAYRYRKNIKRSFRSAKDYVMGDDKSDKKAEKSERKALAKEIVKQERKALQQVMKRKSADAKKAAKKAAKVEKKAAKKAAKAEKKAAKKAAKSGQAVAAPAHTPFGDAVIEALKAELAASKAREETIRAEANALVDDAMAQMREAQPAKHVVPRKQAVLKKVAGVK